MKKNRIDNEEGNAWYNCLTCIPWLLLDFIIASAIGFLVPGSFDVIAGVLLIPMGIIYLWFIGWLGRGRWYLEYDEQGVTYRAVIVTRKYPWPEISNIYSKKSPAFMGKYHDTLVIESEHGSKEFFLHDYGLRSKKTTVRFIDAIVGEWTTANPSAAGSNQESREKPSETDEEDIYDEEC